MSDSLLIKNARIVTLTPESPGAIGMSLVDGLVEHLYAAASEMPAPTGGEILDFDGATVMPGFVDAHCHPLALGAHLSAVDCGPGVVGSIADLVERIRTTAAPGRSGWVRAVGYDELLLREKRHPTHFDLDKAFPATPVVLTHGSGHAAVLNSIAMSELGLDAATDEPPGGTIDRDPVTGEPTGLLIEMPDWLASRLPVATNRERLARLKRAAGALLSAGVTSVTDAGHRNDGGRYALYEQAGRSVFPLRTCVMLRPGVDRSELEATATLRPGLTKLMVTASAGRLHPGAAEIRQSIELAVAGDSPGVAIHAVERAAIVAAAEAIRAIRAAGAPSGFVMRIEHAAEAPPAVVAAVAESGAAVVAQPGFIYSRGDRYLAAVDGGGPAPEDLYPLRAFMDAGVAITAGSDAPYGTWKPLEGVRAAVERRATSGHVVGASQAVAVREALSMYSGSLRVGGRADFVVLSANPLRHEVGSLADIEVIATYIGGERVSGTS